MFGAAGGLGGAVGGLKSRISRPPKSAAAEHVGSSKKVPNKQRVRQTVADAGKDKCVGNVCAIMKNKELRAGPESGYTVAEIESASGVNFGRAKSGAANPAVATPARAVRTIEKVTGLKATNPKTPVNFAEATAKGQYAIFVNKSHVVYANISPKGRVSILDANVGRGWGSWNAFLKYAKKNPSLYGPNPAKLNQAYHFVKK